MKVALSLGVMLLGLTMGPVVAASPSQAQLDEYYARCMSWDTAQSECKCRTDVVARLVDADQMQAVISSYQVPGITQEYITTVRALFDQAHEKCGS